MTNSEVARYVSWPFIAVWAFFNSFDLHTVWEMRCMGRLFEIDIWERFGMGGPQLCGKQFSAIQLI